MKASKLTARSLAYVVQGIGRKIAKHNRARQTPHGKQSVRKLMAHGASASSIELSGDTKLFDRVARKWNVDYAFYKTGPDKYLLFFKSGQADAMTACFSEYSRKPLTKKQAADYELRPAPDISELRRESSDRPRSIAQQMKEAAALAEANRGDPAPKKKAPDRGDR